MFIFGKHKLSFYISTALWLRKYDGFNFSSNHTIEASRDFLGGAPSSWFSTLPSFGDHGPYECGDKTFLIDTWARDRCVTWLCRWGFLILRHDSAKLGIHRPCKSGDITFFICHVTTTSECHVALWVGSPHPKSYYPTRFGVHRPNGNGNNGVCSISSNSNAEVPLPRFTNGR